ncbi:BgtAc-31295 [Blumeria graminis f. sp. tritici]|uniref:BgtAc-31295 n=2 Tax=Blumeria graminis f. sp. tritici TaxID=62690 RepID=A0A9X9QGN2_BLUGR|nr:hypothetical protein BGT96224_Ac31295 [Blumeria graminis f. sp. tritici 96224]VDB95122.1 BgtAc-31295 [Blumeria graminis f. sp. tritici]
MTDTITIPVPSSENRDILKTDECACGDPKSDYAFPTHESFNKCFGYGITGHFNRTIDVTLKGQLDFETKPGFLEKCKRRNNKSGKDKVKTHMANDYKNNTSDSENRSPADRIEDSQVSIKLAASLQVVDNQ